MIDVLNLQRKVKLNTSEIRTYIARLNSAVGEADGKTFSVAFISDKRMNELNKFFRGKDATTDVLSFPHEVDAFGPEASEFALRSTEIPAGTQDTSAGPVFLGDIVISAEQAERQAKENRGTLENEIEQLLLHGLLHLCGYDHETDGGEMNRRELELRKKLRI